MHVYRCKLCGGEERYDLGPMPNARRHVVFYGARCGGLMTVTRIEFDIDAEDRYRAELRAMTVEQRIAAGLCCSFFDESDRWCPNVAAQGGACDACSAAAFDDHGVLI